MDDGLMRAGHRTLNPGEVLRLRDAAARHLEVLRGTVWITQLGDARDPVIEAGGSFRFDRGGVALVQALGGDALIVLEEGLVPEVAPRAEIDYPSLGRKALRLREEAIRTLFAAAGAELKAAWNRVRTWAGRGPAGAGRGLGGLNDHVLRDLGFSRDQLPLAGRAEPCVHC